MTNTIEAVFFDLDGTLFENKNQVVPPSALECLYQLKEKGIKIIICSSRAPEEMEHFPREVYDLFDLVVQSGGTIILEKGEVLRKIPFVHSQIKQVIAYCDQHEIVCRYSTPSQGGYFSKYKRDDVDGIFAYLYHTMPGQKPYEDEEVTGFYAYQTDDDTKAALAALIPDANIINLRRVLEFTPKGVNKGSAMAWCCEYLKVDPNHTMAFGDGYNDIPLFEKAALSVAVGNAREEVQKAADFVSKRNDEDGIRYALKHFGLV
ncbi:MAG: Cof-type HAD-IIB family hydrolase [Erysipelotrichaceae bacterium]|jgi:Cof subfamily protein (haloacid dehalogenase superfamily)|nr:Cof-type HAD-IIB family hydrolase [Erysipelotrichaceae bacterium]